MYSNEDGCITCEKPEQMKQFHVSSGWTAFETPGRL